MTAEDPEIDSIDSNFFTNAVLNKLNRDIASRANQGQCDAINAPLTTSLFIVAGPGSGKTTVMTLKVLRMIFVNDVDPRSIVLTTFTRKAATELESRVLGWGDMLRRYFLDQNLSKNLSQRLLGIDFTKIYVGTIDSLAQDIMSEYKRPGEIEPVVIEEFVARALMLRYGLFDQGRFNSPELKSLLIGIKNDNSSYISVREMADMLTKLKDRIYTDMIPLNQIRVNGQNLGLLRMAEAIESYQQKLTDRNLFDFGKLEDVFLTQLRTGRLQKFLERLQFVMVDEYQDTNLLQESIYFEIARSAIGNGGNITVVGDDDQSLYRFRGATVELFRDFEQRLNQSLGIQSIRIYLSINYRSTNQIIDFVNRYVELDTNYRQARVLGKPRIQHRQNGSNATLPVLVMFRQDISTLIEELNEFIQSIVIGNGYTLGNGNIIRRNHTSGSPSDVAILTYSPKETSSGGKGRLPLLIKDSLENGTNRIRVFNSRGKDISAEELIMRLNGLILEIIDPQSVLQDTIRVPNDVVKTLQNWRQIGRNYAQVNANRPVRRITLANFIADSQQVFAGAANQTVRTISLTSLIYNLISWMPDFYNDITGLAYLELITRTIEQSSIINSNYGNLTTGGINARFQESSISEVIWNIFVPIATNSVDLNEDLFETLPPDRLNILSFHQAKGLEFPLVIVDVGSEFQKRHWKQAFKRFPTSAGETSGIEDFVRNFSQLGSSARTALDRDFDDLIRAFFVGFSRAQDCLLIIGLNGNKDGTIPNVATGWTRSGDNNWDVLANMVREI